MNVRTGTYQLLLVEDDPNDIMLLERAFRKANLPPPVHTVRDGEAAIDYLAGNGEYANREQFPLPSVVLLDLKMPRRSGFEVLDWIRNEPRINRLPVVVFTSSSDTNDVDRAYALGANSYLVKPVEFATLQQLIETLCLYWLFANIRPPLGDGPLELPSSNARPHAERN